MKHGCHRFWRLTVGSGHFCLLELEVEDEGAGKIRTLRLVVWIVCTRVQFGPEPKSAKAHKAQPHDRPRHPMSA